MPYIKKEFRTEELNKAIDTIVNLIDNSNCRSCDGLHPGMLNYTISMIVNKLININKVSYSNINKMVGVLECVKLELYRRLAAPYEDKMIKDNGDIY